MQKLNRSYNLELVFDKSIPLFNKSKIEKFIKSYLFINSNDDCWYSISDKNELDTIMVVIDTLTDEKLFLKYVNKCRINYLDKNAYDDVMKTYSQEIAYARAN